MKSVCIFYDVDFQDLRGTPEDVAGDSLEGKEDLIVAETPYNARNEGRIDNYSHSIFMPEDTSDFG